MSSVGATSSVPAVGVGIDVGGTHLRAALVGPDGLVGPVLRGRSVTDEAPLRSSVSIGSALPEDIATWSC